MRRTAKRLFTPGPLNTSASVKEAMLVDMGSRDEDFIRIVAEIRAKILKAAGLSRDDGYEAIPMQGSGTFGIEAVLSTAVAPEDRLLILVNGAYGRRIAQIASCLQLNHEILPCPENELHDTEAVEAALKSSQFSFLAVVHCETTTGILNPVTAFGALARQYRCQFIVDAMSSFGAIPLDVADAHVDFLISSSNKCLQGVPGFAFVIARRAALNAIKHRARSVSLNLLDQYQVLEKTGQFRFTPPTHAMLAFHQALLELEDEGGVAQRAQRYRQNHGVLVAGMRRLGFQEYLPAQLQSNIITSFLYPQDPQFDFTEFYQRLSAHDMLIYPGKLSEVDCFRIGNIGHLDVEDIQHLLAAIEQVLTAMRIEIPLLSG